MEGKTQPSVNLRLQERELITPPEKKKGKGIAQSPLEFVFQTLLSVTRERQLCSLKGSFLWGEILLLPAEVLPDGA